MNCCYRNAKIYFISKCYILWFTFTIKNDKDNYDKRKQIIIMVKGKKFLINNNKII